MPLPAQPFEVSIFFVHFVDRPPLPDQRISFKIADQCPVEHAYGGEALVRKIRCPVNKIAAVFEVAGVAFTDLGGVEPRNNLVTVLEGDDANYRVLDDIYHTLKDTGGEILIAGLSEVDEGEKERYDFLIAHLERLQEVGITERILIEEGDTNLVAPAEWYRCIPKDKFSNTPFQIYGNRIAMKEWGETQRIVVIEHPRFAATLRNLFDLVWEQATPAIEAER